MILDVVGLPIGPLLASAGIVGVAVGFGAQSLVKDFLSGIFLILEDQYGVGDLVDTGMGTVGTIEAVGLRVTRLRDGSGVVWYVRNGEILQVGNHSQGWSTGIVDVSVAYTEDIPRVQRLIGEIAAAMAEDGRLAAEDPRAADRGRRRVGDRDVGDDPGHREVRAERALRRAARAAGAHQGGVRPRGRPGAAADVPRRPRCRRPGRPPGQP